MNQSEEKTSIEEEESNEFRRTVLKYLKIIPTRFQLLCASMRQIKKQLEHLEMKVVLMGSACNESFKQTKTVVNHLAQTQEAMNDDLSYAAGSMPSSPY